jgi:hypothetical protein
MVITTKQQRQSLYKLWRRQPNWTRYREFRSTVQPTIGCDGAVVVPWCGMWVCIETDGYTHT